MAFQMNKKPYLIGISGGSGSGKTFFLNSFLNHFNPSDVCLISQDDYYIPAGDLTPEENKLYNFDIPSSFDEEHFTSDIQKILNGETIYKKEYTFNNKQAGDPKILEIKSAPIIVLEGLFVLHFQKIAELIDMKIFIDSDANIALKRRLKRDLEERGWDIDNVMYKWTNHILPAYQTYLRPYRDTADKVIVNNTNVPDDILLITEEISRDLKKRVLELIS